MPEPLRPQEELAKRMYMQTMDLLGVPNYGASRPKPVFLEDLELVEVIDRVISDNRVSGAFDLKSI